MCTECVCAVMCVVCVSVCCVYGCTRALCMCLFATCVREQCVCKGSPRGIEQRRASKCRRCSATPVCPCHPVPPAVSPGQLCERAEDRCLQHNPCLHGGTCKGNACICPEGYTGPYCQHSECGDMGRYGGHVGDMWEHAACPHHPLACRHGAVRAGPGLAGRQRGRWYGPQGCRAPIFPFFEPKTDAGAGVLSSALSPHFPADAPGQFSASFRDGSYLALPGHLFPRR